ncbi:MULTISPECIES: hypothetical protein [Pseudomonas syringae group]|uniref:hypothetical protein n=1 Tax=Pseudomonas syringae group TaxID=136849 RepID=UPI000F3CD1EF|nr:MULTISPECIES: hypothetical protein [Pseudomonas syringae group]RMM22875.1 hypothetical protein ALQ83_01840 [Pseudomonas syringae pv. berberidis]
MNPPIGAIKDRLIGGFGEKSKVSNVNYRLEHQNWLIMRWGISSRIISVCSNRNRKPASNVS